jgi:HSP20 family protein
MQNLPVRSTGDVRRSPSPIFSHPIDLLTNWFRNPVWHSAFGMPDLGLGSTTNFSDDVVEHDTNFIVSVDMPGVKSADVDVSVRDSVLTIVWERTGSRFGSYTQSYTLPYSVDGSLVEASLEDGVLTVRIPRITETTSKRVEVKTKTKKTE